MRVRPPRSPWLVPSPRLFRSGPELGLGDKISGYAFAAQVGDPPTDNSRRVDGCRFHNAIRLGFLAVLNWSPALRAVLRLRRKSSPGIDECEDGARAVYVEASLAAVSCYVIS